MKFKTEHEVPWAQGPELFTIRSGDWRYQRPVVNESKCSGCGACYLFCPCGCIKDVGRYYEADLDYCKGCGICAAMCPISAIKMMREE